MKIQGTKLFKNFDSKAIKYPAVLIIDTDISSDDVVGPFNNAEELNAYIKKEKLNESFNSYAVKTLDQPTF
jgi:hypothetical protein